MELVLILKILLIIAFILLFVLVVAYIMIILKNQKDRKVKQGIGDTKKAKIKAKQTSGMKNSATEDVYDFMEFDEIKDNMIIRKNRKQYVMVIKCKGVNYDLMSEEEKVSVEAGFVQFLNTLRFPVQLYIQTTSLNLRDIIEDYRTRIRNLEKDVRKIEENMYMARSKGNQKQYDKLYFELKRKENILEYGADISEYIARMSANKDILQQKTYVVISYFSAEVDQSGNFSKEEIDGLCFSELYTRTQTTIRALGTSGVIGKILDSEELAELLYAAYNRDESETMTLKRALDAEYDALYSTGKDVLKKREEVINEMIEREAVNLAADSITIADEKRRNDEKIAKKAMEILEEYKTQMDEDLYEKSKEEIISKTTKKAKRTRKPKKADIK